MRRRQARLSGRICSTLAGDLRPSLIQRKFCLHLATTPEIAEYGRFPIDPRSVTDLRDSARTFTPPATQCNSLFCIAAMQMYGLT